MPKDHKSIVQDKNLNELNMAHSKSSPHRRFRQDKSMKQIEQDTPFLKYKESYTNF
jgi:hypothetical protein